MEKPRVASVEGLKYCYSIDVSYLPCQTEAVGQAQSKLEGMARQLYSVHSVPSSQKKFPAVSLKPIRISLGLSSIQIRLEPKWLLRFGSLFFADGIGTGVMEGLQAV